MSRFYFNECLPESNEEHVQTIFETMLYNFKCLCDKAELKIDRAIITHDEPSKVIVCETNLSHLIKNCFTKEIKTLAYSWFTKYPIDSLYKIESVFTEENINIKYQFKDINAMNLVIAHKLGWYALSIPVCDAVKSDTLSIICNDTDHINIHNWYSENNQYIEEKIRSNLLVAAGNFDILKGLFIKESFYASPDFIKDFNNSSINIQEVIIKKFRDAISRNLLFPIKADDDFIKICKGRKNSIYELRQRSNGGIRVYFKSTKDSIYIGGLGNKAKYSGSGQSRDISKAEREIGKLES